MLLYNDIDILILPLAERIKEREAERFMLTSKRYRKV